MGISAGTVWEVRSAGSDTNGGLFLSSQPGAGNDYSQQDNPQLTLSDIVTNGTSTVTSATGGFTAAMVGNGINIAGIPYMIATRTNTNTITVDRVIGAAVGQTGNVGGALGSLGFCTGQISSGGDTIYVKAGAYTISSGSANVSNGLIQPAGYCYIIGYQTVRGDNGTKPVFTASGIASVILFWLKANKSYVSNIAIDGANLTGITGFYAPNATLFSRCKVSNCKATGFQSDSHATCSMCEATGCSVQQAFYDLSCFDCVAHDNLFGGFAAQNLVNVSRCISCNNTGATSDGFACLASFGGSFTNCTAYGNGRHGFLLLATPGFVQTATNCLAVGNAGYGFTAASAVTETYLTNCAGYSNTSGNVNATNILGVFSQGFVSLTADPFTSAAGNDFSLNSVAGGGTACKEAGIPGIFAGLSTTGYLDVGAAQHQDPAAPTFPPAYDVYAGVDRGDGVLGTLHASNIATAAGSGSDLSAGILKSGSVVDDVTGTYTGGGGGGGMAGAYTLVINRIPS